MGGSYKKGVLTLIVWFGCFWFVCNSDFFFGFVVNFVVKRIFLRR